MIVHILHHGYPLCGFTEVLPGDWPEGHRWISKASWKLVKEGAGDPETAMLVGRKKIERYACPSCVAQMDPS